MFSTFGSLITRCPLVRNAPFPGDAPHHAEVRRNGWSISEVSRPSGSRKGNPTFPYAFPSASCNRTHRMPKVRYHSRHGNFAAHGHPAPCTIQNTLPNKGALLQAELDNSKLQPSERYHRHIIELAACYVGIHLRPRNPDPEFHPGWPAADGARSQV